MRNHNPLRNRIKHAIFGAFSGDPSDDEQKEIDERQSEGDRREAIFVEFVESIEEFAKLIDSGRVDGTETITYGKIRSWLPQFLPSKLLFSIHKETAKVLYGEGRGKKGRSLIAVTESGTLVSSFMIDRDRWINGPVERVVNVNRVHPNDIHPDTWWRIERATQQAKSVLAYAKNREARS